MHDHGKFAAYLTSGFQLYLMEHEKIASGVPENAMVLFDVAGESHFNSWHHEMSMKHREPDQPVVRVHVGKMLRHAAIEQVELSPCSM